jgi:glycoprotein endo-alpha-1,2-mannosidase
VFRTCRPGIECNGSNLLPVVYIYDSYQISASEWAAVFLETGALTVRRSAADVVALALLVELRHKEYFSTVRIWRLFVINS